MSDFCFEPAWDKATPLLESVPERTYERTGLIVKCYKIPDYKNPGAHEDDPLFIIELNTEEEAKLLIKDIYCGEYTGA